MHFTEALLVPLIDTSYNISEVTRRVYGKDSVTGDQTRYVKRRCIELGIDISKFELRPIKQGHRPSTERLRSFMFRSGIAHRCAVCDLGPVWCGAALTLQVDHVNGDRFDHSVTNLRFLCPNCHAQTPTFTGKKRPEFETCR